MVMGLWPHFLAHPVAGIKSSTSYDQCWFHTGEGRTGAQAPTNRCYRPPNLAVLLAHCGQLILTRTDNEKTYCRKERSYSARILASSVNGA